ncbi:AMP-binding protein [Vibrio rarus]|uniref:AMP-binding protein n=1 Tax=Vibrio rarus TaxID=413403 RepID=UPI0021C2E141|nr:AMP-binding protein [Vibrio rarus]
MYDDNYLANVLRQGSYGHDSDVFAYQVDSGVNTNYAQLFNQAERLAAVLQQQGVVSGDRVAVQVAKSVTTVQLYLATILVGGVFLPLNTDYTANEVEYFLCDATPKVLVCDPNLFDDLTSVANKAKVTAVLTLSEDGGSGSLVDLMHTVTGNCDVVPRQASDLAAILYTSGTTGRSKGAMLSHGALASNATTLADVWQFSRQDCLIHALPIFHIHGLFVAINITLCVGASLQFLTKFDPEKVATLMPNSTVLMGVPTFYVRLLKTDILNKQLTSNMRLFVSGSAPLLTETHHQWQAVTGHAILERYGMTETNMNTSNPYHGERKAGTVGLALPGVDVKICHPISGEELPAGDIGQIEVKGPNVFSGYWNMPQKTAAELRTTGWFLTGDMGVCDEQGYISIVGRSKDLIISGGYNVYPKEIEGVIDDVQGVVESAVIGAPHPDFGEAVVAVVVASKGREQQQLQRSIREKMGLTLAKFKQPKQMFFIDELPRNTMGKVQKAQLRAQYQQLFMS